MPGEYLFTSDSHLHPGQPGTMQLFTDFLENRAAGASRLYILGDLFEAWLGDDDDSLDYLPVIAPLCKLAETCEIFFMAGNRDFLIGDGFATRTGVRLLQESHLLELGQSRVVLLHGDTLCTDDHDYQAFRVMVRNPDWQALFLAKPLQERQQIAAQLRQHSVEAMSQKSEEIMDVNKDTVMDCFQQHDADIIVHGHTHRPAIHDYPGNLRRIVMGDWVNEPSYLSWTEEKGFQLFDHRVPG